MGFRAIVVDGNQSDKVYKGYLAEQNCISLFALCGKALQVDGSFGVTAAITEMLMQSHDGFIQLLPAFPDEWTEGEFKGVCARGAFELNFTWENRKVTSIRIVSKAGGVCRIATGRNINITCNGKTVKYTKLSNGIVELNTIKGEVYVAN